MMAEHFSVDDPHKTGAEHKHFGKIHREREPEPARPEPIERQPLISE